MSHADMSHTISTLRSICHTAQRIRKLTETQQAPSYKSSRTFPELQLSFPDEVLSTLKSMELPKNTYAKLQKKLFSWYQQMQAVHRQHYIQACQRLCSVNIAKSDSTFESIRLAFEASFSKRYVPVIASHVRSLKERYQWSQKRQSRRQPFQQAFTPLLEQYFDQNAYPSASDRVALANRTTNTPRQIEVWFQNHRNRAKKDGKTLNRSSSPSIIRDLFSSFASPVDSDSAPSDRYYVASEDDEERETDDERLSPPTPNTEMPNLLNPPRPAHAFPTTFSERSNFDPFQKKTGLFTFSPFIWPRQPTSSRTCSGLQVDFDTFITEFAEKLHLRDKSPKKQIPCSRKTRLASDQSWFSSTVVVPPKAPLSSLVRTSSCYSGLSQQSQHHVSHHSTAQSGTERRHRLTRFPANASQRSYPSWGSRSSSLSSISSTEPMTPPTSPSTDNLDLKIAGADYDILQEILGPTAISGLISDTFKFPDIPYGDETASFLFSPALSNDIFSQTF